MGMHASTAPIAVPVTRDHAWVEREYNREKYPVVLDAVRRALAAGERDLSRVVGRVIESERGALALDMRRAIAIDGVAMTLPLALASAGVSGYVTQALAQMCTPETSAVIELGSGWGRNLFNLHLSGATEAHTTFYALEYAQSAREAAALVAGTAPDLAFAANAFDYHAPDYSMIAPTSAPALLATIHSVEQIPYLKPEVFLKLIERRPNLSAVHLEPIGWQLPAHHLGGRAPCSSREYAQHHDYNRNLWDVLTELDRSSVIEILEVAGDVIGMNPRNPSTLIRWRTRR